MKNQFPRKLITLTCVSEKESAKILIGKMGLKQTEFKEIIDSYGVDPSKILELMQMSKYSFVFPDKTPRKCMVVKRA